jgi:hypothetical protein
VGLARPALTEADKRDVRLFHVHKEQPTIEHTWNVSGMRGSGSHAVVLEDVFVPAELTANIDVPLRIDRPPYRLKPILLVLRREHLHRLPNVAFVPRGHPIVASWGAARPTHPASQ